MDIYEFLEKNMINYSRHDHPPVYTVEQADRLVPALPGAKTKSLFLKDRKGKQHYLVVTEGDKVTDLKALAADLGCGKLGLASPERLQKYLGIEPGAVSLLAIVKDTTGQVELVIDKSIWEASAVLCHPLVNTNTLVLSHASLEHFLALTGHTPILIDIPAR